MLTLGQSSRFSLESGRSHVGSRIFPCGGARRRSAFVLTLCVAVLLFQQGATALPQPSDALRFFNNFFVTGGMSSAASACGTQGSGTINVSKPAAPMTAAPGRRRAGRVSVLAGRDLRRSQRRRRERWGDVQRLAAQHSARGTCHRPRWAWAGTTRVRSMAVAAGRSTRSAPMSSVSRRRRPERSARHQQGGRLSRLAAEQHHGQDAGRQPGRDLPASGSGDTAERHRPVRRHVREAAAGDAPAADRRVLRSRERARTNHLHCRKRAEQSQRSAGWRRR